MYRKFLAAALAATVLVGCGANGTDSSESKTRAVSTTTLDPKVAKTAITAEIQRVCDDSVTTNNPLKIYGKLLKWEDAWDAVGDRPAALERLENCVTDGRAVLEKQRKAAEAEQERKRKAQEEADAKAEADRVAAEQAARQALIDNAQPVQVDAVIKNPDAVKGQVFLVIVQITQYDAATGVCSFRGNWDNEAHEYNFEYAGDNAFFTAGDAISTCPELDGIDQGDTVRLWAEGAGSFSYDTQNGGNTTAPSFVVLKAEILTKD